MKRNILLTFILSCLLIQFARAQYCGCGAPAKTYALVETSCISPPSCYSFPILPVLPLKPLSPCAAQLLASLPIPSDNPLLPPQSPVSAYANPVSACMPPAIPPSCAPCGYARRICITPPYI
ncbi:unnamed protein product [Plutella xylostella]|uniref:(diamondback moth) hypothetical protein n=1 Tax=Plutella xylostella TaxID=51655 RepID=A0A8S4G1U6_PLUXY|nr:unnamed protein product [Plutella xylostella]